MTAAEPECPTAAWLRSPRMWRGLLLAALLVGAFTWGVVALRIGLAMAQQDAEQCG